MSSITLHTFEVNGFRGIRKISLPNLAQVNLFVGKNNAGKSALLEAIRLFLEDSTGGVAGLIYEVVREHTDFIPRFSSNRPRGEIDTAEIEAAVSAAESLFFGGFDGAPAGPIRLKSGDGRELVIYGPRSTSMVQNSLFDAPSSDGDHVFFGPDSPLFTIGTPSPVREIPVGLFLRNVPLRFRNRGHTMRIPAGGLDAYHIRELWDRLAVAGEAESVERAMSSIWPDFDRALTAGEAGRRSVFVKLKGIARAVPLQSLGDGVQRVFALAVGLVLAQGGALVVDEVENGLHHTAQHEVWESIFSLAEQLNVQVFVTTHSWEAVVAFQAAANRSPAAGMLYRLEREQDGSVYVERYTEKDVAVAAEHQVEVR